MRGRGLAVFVVVVVLAAAACSNSSGKSASTTTTTGKSGGGGSSSASGPGITADTIRVGGVVSKTNPLNGPYASGFDGVKAYFAMVNSQGGIYGKKLQMVSERDDALANNKQEVQGLLAQDNVFAVLPIATILSFSGAQTLADQNVPTFGWNINSDWTGHPNEFGSNYGALCLGCAASSLPFLARELGKKHIGVLAYTVENSAQCADGVQKSFQKYPTADVPFLSKSLSFGATDFSVEVRQMKEKHVDFVTTCMDNTAVLNLAKEMRKQGMNAIQYLPNGYDASLVKPNAQFFEGSYVGIPFVPFQFTPKPPGLVQYDTWMRKQGYESNEIAINGWISAAMFVEGLKAAGPDFTRQKVIDGLNKMTAQTVDGLIPPRNWTVDHNITHNLACTAYVKVAKNGDFVPTLNQPGKPFQCLPDQPAKLPAKASYL